MLMAVRPSVNADAGLKQPPAGDGVVPMDPVDYPATVTVEAASNSSSDSGASENSGGRDSSGSSSGSGGSGSSAGSGSEDDSGTERPLQRRRIQQQDDDSAGADGSEDSDDEAAGPAVEPDTQEVRMVVPLAAAGVLGCEHM